MHFIPILRYLLGNLRILGLEKLIFGLQIEGVLTDLFGSPHLEVVIRRYRSGCAGSNCKRVHLDVYPNVTTAFTHSHFEIR